MENNQDNLQNAAEERDDSQNVITNNPSDRRPDEQEQNDTGYAGTTNSISQNHQESDEYKTAIEDTMIGYDGDESDLDIELGNGDVNTENTRGIDDND
ncbi:MAG TPA: hypothetical protein VGB63_08985 [Pedobacter sp.]|jgi:hypothetical protein